MTQPVPGKSFRSSSWMANIESRVVWSSASRVTVVPISAAVSTTGRTLARASSWPPGSAWPNIDSFTDISARGPSSSGFSRSISSR
ncbi:hypothetical protein SALBM217S_09353 [Streptomyces griseoloalbus]